MENVVSAAAVQAMRHSDPSSQSAIKDLLVLHTSGRLGLYIAARLVCYVVISLPAAAPSNAYEALIGNGPNAGTGAGNSAACLALVLLTCRLRD